MRVYPGSLCLALLIPVARAEPLRQPAPHQVEISSFDGVALHATYYDAGRAGPAIIIFRNCDRDRTSLDAFAARLSEKGIHTLTWDYRGGLASGLSWGQTRVRDAEAAATWLLRQPGVDAQKLVAIGGSCGVGLALDFISQHSPTPLGVVVLSGPSDPDERAFLSKNPQVAVFGGASQAEGAAVPYIDSIVRSSSNPANQFLTPADGGHGTEMLKRQEFESVVMQWIEARFR